MKISIAELQPGVSLTQDVVSPSGQLLLKSGVPLTEKHLRAFKMWGITSLEIAGESEGAESSFSPEIIVQAELVLKDRFYGADLAHLFLQKIYHYSLHREAKKIADKPRAA